MKDTEFFSHQRIFSKTISRIVNKQYPFALFQKIVEKDL